MYKRLISQQLRQSRRSALLLGPRQTGKSTLLAGLAPDLTINLAHPRDFRSFLKDPSQLEREVQALSQSATVFIDEVQKVPALLDMVQVLIDSNQDIRFLLSGSSARKLRRCQANMLPGRVHLFALHPLVSSELGEDFELERVMAHGSLPGIYTEQDPQTRAQDLRSYVDIYLREEIQAEAILRRLDGYARLIDLVAAESGKILNIQSLSREVQLGYETTRRYVQILEDTLIVFRIPAWSRGDKGTLVQHPRLYFFDLGVRNALLHRSLERVNLDEIGILLEHLVAYELQRRIGSLWPNTQLYYYRTKHGLEVDFILRIDGQELWLIEVKASEHISQKTLRTLDTVSEKLPNVTRKIVIYTGIRKQKRDGIEIIPFKDFALSLPNG